MKKIITLILSTIMCTALIISSAISVGAASNITLSGTSGDSKVTITTESTPFKVTVPSVLPIWVDSDNNVTVATNAKIINQSTAPVDVTRVSVIGENSWSLVPFNTDFTKVPVDTKQYGMMMQGADVFNGVDALLFDRMEGGAELGVNYDGNIAIQSSDINKLDIGHVVFTVAWAKGQRLGINDIAYDIENETLKSYMAQPDYDYSDHTYTNMTNITIADDSDSPAYGELEVPDGAVKITVTSKTDGKTFTDSLSDSKYNVKNLIPNITYVYQMKDSSNNVVKTGNIYPSGQVRMIENESSTLGNMRDLGGWQTSGGRIKYGRIFRGSRLEGLSDHVKSVLTDFLGITSEIDLRKTDEYPADASQLER